MEDKKKNLYYLIAFAILSILIWHVPGGYYIIYPFTILSTWFHEMGHGLTALILGGQFQHIEIFPDGSGLASFSGSLYLGNIGRALVAAGGPLGPTLVGIALISATKHEKITIYLLPIFASLLFISVFLLIQGLFGIIIILLISIILFYIAFRMEIKWKLLTLQFIGIQACLSLYMNIEYLFMEGAIVGGVQYRSDVGVMENALIVPYWIWGLFIVIFSIFLIFKSLKYVFSE
jgi:hypothetical protein